MLKAFLRNWKSVTIFGRGLQLQSTALFILPIHRYNNKRSNSGTVILLVSSCFFTYREYGFYSTVVHHSTDGHTCRILIFWSVSVLLYSRFYLQKTLFRSSHVYCIRYVRNWKWACLPSVIMFDKLLFILTQREYCFYSTAADLCQFCSDILKTGIFR